MDRNVIDKVHKLLNHAAGTDNEAEATAFIEKAQRLMVEHAISQELLEAHEKVSAEVIVTRDIIIQKSTPGTNGKRDLLTACASANRCRTWFTSGESRSVIAGYEADVEYSVLLYTYLLMQMDMELVFAIADAPMDISQRTFKANFVSAYASKIYSRLTAMNQKVEPESGTSMALVLVGRKDAVDKYVDNRIPNMRTHKYRMTGDGNARAAGRAAGERADLTGSRANVPRIGG